MTICIAAICEDGTICGAADRMLTAGDIQFEPNRKKILQITPSITIMLAGDTTLQAEITQELISIVNNQININPTNLLNVKYIADIYINIINRYKQKRAENAILIPLGLDTNTFITRQCEMTNEFLMSITKELLSFKIPQLSAIITGVDHEGSHVFEVHDNQINCMDSIGFSTIGSGSRHAQSQFMLARYSRNKQLSETLLLTFLAKKRSEVSPEIGTETDIFIQGPGLEIYPRLKDEIYQILEDEYLKTKKIEEEILQNANKSILEYIQTIQKETQNKGNQTGDL